MPLPTNILEQIKGFKGEKKAGEVVEFINTTYPQLKINKFHVYSAWKGSPRKKIAKTGKPEKVKGKRGKGKRAIAAGGPNREKDPGKMTLDEIVNEIYSIADQLAAFYRGTLMAIRGDLLKKTSELRKSHVEDPDELKLGEGS